MKGQFIFGVLTTHPDTKNVLMLNEVVILLHKLAEN